MKNFTNNFKQFTSRLSARWLIMALMLLVGTSSAWAATITSDGTACLYFNMKAIDWWNNDGVTHFAYFFNDTSGKNAWSTKAVNYNGDYYYVKIPSGTWEKVILTRNSSNATNGSWDNKHNQTANIPLSSSSNYLSYFKEGSNDASTNDYTWGTAIKPTSTASLSASSTSVNTGVDVTLTPSLTSNTTYNEIKSTTYSISPTSGASISGNKFTATAAGTYTVTATITYNPRGYSSLTSTVKPTITITVTNPVTVTSYQLAGFNDWSNPITMTKNGNIYTCAKELTAKTYTGGTNEAGFKIIENYSNSTKKWYGNDGTMERDNCSGWTMAVDKNNCGITADVAGTYTFTFDATNKKLTVKYPPECTPSATITEATYSCYGNTIHLEGSLTEACGGMYYGWQYKTTAGDDWSTATPIVGHATNNYSESTTTYELDWTIPDPGTTYYFRAYATLDAKTWYSDGTFKTVTTYARATQYNVTGNENTLTLSGSQTGYTYTLYDTNGAVAESSKTGTGNALTWNLSGVSTFIVKARPTGSTCDEEEMDGNYTNRIDPISDVTLSYCDEEGGDIADPNPMCKGATAYVKLSYVGSKYSDIKWLVEGVETDNVTDEGDGVWSYIIQGTGQISVELRNDANKDEDNPTWATSNKLSFTMKEEPVAPYISINPASGVLCEGNTATITVTNPSTDCAYKLVEEGSKAGFTDYESGDLKYSVGSVGKYYVAAQHIACRANEYTSNQVEINQIISTSASISIEPANPETTPWEPVTITVNPEEGYVYELSYTGNNLAGVDGVIIKQNGDSYTYYIPRPWGTGDATPVRTAVEYGIKAQLKVDGEASQCDLNYATATIQLKDEDNEDCNQ